MTGTGILREERIGNQRLILGDCLQVMPGLGRFDAVVTDPPYGVGLKHKVTKHNTIAASRTYEDEPEHVLPLVLEAVRLAREIADCVVVTPGNRLLQSYPRAKSIGTIFSANGAGCDSWGFSGNNPILYYGSCPYLRRGLGSRPNSLYSAHPGLHVTGEDKWDHPCPKPIAWMQWLVIRASPAAEETILDPFMGSGTTLVACQRLGRHGTGIELDPEYFDIACRRVDEAARQPDLLIPETRAAATVQEGFDL